MLFFKRLKSFLFRLDNLKIDKSKIYSKFLYFFLLKFVNFYRWIIAIFLKNKAKSLNEFFNFLNIYWYGGNEGHTQQIQEETQLLKDKSKNPISILEIGFNGGHSSETFLNSNNKNIVESVDIGYHHYVNFGNYYLKNKYKTRFRLLVGKSSIVLKELIRKKKMYDLIFIDGSHEYTDVIIDLTLSQELSNKKTLIILDDVYLNKQLDASENFDSHNIGPTKAWKEFIDNNLIIQTGYVEFKSTNTNKRSIVYGHFKEL